MSIKMSTLSPGSRSKRKEIIEYTEIKDDVIVVAGTQSFKCPKSLLVKHSDWFKTNIDRLMKFEHLKGNLKLSLRGIAPETFHVIYDWLWIAKLPKCCDILGVMKAAKRLQMPELIGQCHDRIKSKLLDTSNAMSKYEHSVKCCGRVEIDKTLRFLCENFCKIISSRVFLNYKPEQICTLLDFDNLNITSEVQVFDAAVRWLKNNWGCRNQHAIKVLSLVRYGLMDDTELLKLLIDCRYSVLTKLETVQLLFLNAFFYHIAVENNKLDENSDLIPKQRTNLKQKHRPNSAKTVSWSPAHSPNFIDNYISPIPLTPVSVLSPEHCSEATSRVAQSSAMSSSNRTTSRQSTTTRNIREILKEKSQLKPCLINCFVKQADFDDSTESDEDYAAELRCKDVLG